MISEKLQKAINEQINAEVFSGYLYFSMANYFEAQSLKGFAHWLRVQTLEELSHVQKFISYLNSRGGKVHFAAVEAPKNGWNSPLEAFKEVYQHEQLITASINKLMGMAHAESDYASVHFLQWFVGEQVEEEASVDEMVQKLKLVDRTEGGLFMLDQEANKRTFVPLPDIAPLF